jgi:hypothetical protein
MTAMVIDHSRILQRARSTRPLEGTQLIRHLD